MGKRGRKPTPENVLRLRGTFRPDRQSGRDLKPSGELPADPPAWLDAVAADKWRAVRPILAGMDGLCGESDADLLACYCDAWSVYQRCRQRIAADGDLVTVRNGDARHPLYIELHQSIEVILKVGARFGFSPGDRASIKTNGPQTPTAAFAPRKRDTG